MMQIQAAYTACQKTFDATSKTGSNKSEDDLEAYDSGFV